MPQMIAISYVFETTRMKIQWWDVCGQDETMQEAGGCLNKKDGLTRYGDSHVKDKTS